MGEKRENGASDGDGRFLHWWHLGALLGLIAAVEGGRMILRGAVPGELFASLPHSLYAWCPILAGIAVSIRRSDLLSSRAAVKVGVVVTLLMLALDLVGGVTPPPAAFTTTLDRQGNLRSRATTTSGTSWTLTGLTWVRGDLDGIEERIPQGVRAYPGPHPRTRAAEALYDGSLVLLVFGILGLVIAAGRWIRHHVTFRKREDERGAHLVVAWLLSPLALGVAASAADRLFFAALFGNGPLWAILLPAVGLLAVGTFAWVRAARTPPPDEPPDPVGA